MESTSETAFNDSCSSCRNNQDEFRNTQINGRTLNAQEANFRDKVLAIRLETARKLAEIERLLVQEKEKLELAALMKDLEIENKTSSELWVNDGCCQSTLSKTMSQTTKRARPVRIGILGVPFEKGQKKYGVGLAPAAMRNGGLIRELREIDGIDIKDYDDMELPNCNEDVNVENMKNLAQLSGCCKALTKKVQQIIKDDRIPVTIGGDHSISIGTVDGHCNVNNDMILIWIDAHCDINTNKTSVSGNIHGMPVSLLIKEFCDYWPDLPTMEWQTPRFSIKNLGYLGLRSIDAYEKLAIEKYHIPAFSMADIDEYGARKCMQKLLHTLDPENNKPIHVSFDIDAIDSLEAPSTGTAVRGGLTLREAICMMEMIHATGRLRAFDLCEINPVLGSDKDRDKTIEAGIWVLKSALGFCRRGSPPPGENDLPIQVHRK